MCDNPIPPTPSAEGVGGNGSPIYIYIFSIIQYSFTIWNDCRMSATIHSPQPPLQRGLGGMDWRTHSILILLIQYSFSISDENRMCATIQSPQPPLQRGLGGMDLRTHSTLILLTEWEWNDALTMEQMTMELLNEKRMRDIFEWPRFFTPIPVSFLHFWWEKMRKIRSRLQGIRKLSLWTEWTQF